MDLLNAFSTYDFLQNALIGGLLASLLCGVIGVIIVEKKLVMLSGGVSHTAFGGIGLGYFLGIEPIIGAYLFSILASFGITYIHRNERANSDALTGIFWAVGMALGILFIGLTPGYPPDISTYLFGDILTISKSNLWLILANTLFVLVSIVPFYSYWKYYLFDEEFMKVSGFRTYIFDYVLFLLVSISIVSLIKLVGIILVIALLTIPSSISHLFAKSLRKSMIFASLLGATFTVIGLVVSFSLNISSGATIIFFAAGTYFMALILKRFKNNA